MERTLAGVAHLMILTSYVGVLVSLVIWWRERERSRYVAFQAAQAVLYQSCLYLLSILLGFGLLIALWLPFFGLVLSPWGSDSPSGTAGALETLWIAGLFAIALGMVLAAVLLALGSVAYGVYAAVRCFQGRRFRYVLLARLAERMVPIGSRTGV
jgi:uncharacterized Tic20 family protein